MEGREDLAESVKLLQRIQRSQPALVRWPPFPVWSWLTYYLSQIAPIENADVEAALMRLEQRLADFQSSQVAHPTHSPKATRGQDPLDGSTWSVVPEVQWQPCPFGMLPGGVQPNLAVY